MERLPNYLRKKICSVAMSVNTLQNKKLSLSDDINHAQCHQDLYALIDSIPLDQMKTLLLGHVNGDTPTSGEIRRSCYVSSSLLTIIPDDVTRSLFGYLNPIELPRLCLVNGKFNALCQKQIKTESFWDECLLLSPVFSVMFDEKHLADSEYAYEEQPLAYFLQNEYKNKKLNKFWKDETFLKEPDKGILRLCKQHGIDYELKGFVTQPDDVVIRSGDPYYKGRRVIHKFGNRFTGPYWSELERPEFGECFGARPGDIVNGKIEQLDCHHAVIETVYISPFLSINFPSIQWRKSILAKTGKNQNNK